MLATAQGSSPRVFQYMKDNTPGKKRGPWGFQHQNSDWHKPRAPGKDSKKVRIAYFHIWFQWDLCQIILLFDKSNPKKYFVFSGYLEMSLKFTYKHTDTKYHLSVAWDQMRKQGPGWALERVSLWNLTALGSSFSIGASWPFPNQLLHRAGGMMPGAHQAAFLSFHHQKRKESNF